MGVGDAKQDSKVLDAASEQLATITGQRPNVRRARKSIAQFKVREGMPVGVAVTLRGERSYEFLDRLMSVAIPRIRDFRGLNPRSFDGRGNYSMGVREQIIFPEVDYDEVDQVRGLDITITTTAQSDEEAFALLEALGMPFAREGRPEAAATRRKGAHGQDFTGCPSAAHAEVQDARLHPLPPLRPGARRLPQVRRVPDLPARARAQRLHPRNDEVELVDAMSMTDPIADFLTRLRNAANAQHHDVDDAVLEARSARSRASSTSRATSRPTRCTTRAPAGPAQELTITLKYTAGAQAGDHRPAARLAPGPAHVRRPRPHPPHPGRDGHRDHLDLQGRHDRPRGPHRRASAARSWRRSGRPVSTMSRIGRQPIPVPAGVTVAIEPERVTVNGPKGELSERVNRDMQGRAGRTTRSSSRARPTAASIARCTA